MKHLPIIVLLTVIAAWACSNNDDQDTWKEYTQWREDNLEWIASRQAMTNPDGTPYYTMVVPDWNPGSYVLIHWFNNRNETRDNLSPLYTSTVKVRYRLHLYNDVPVDSSDNLTSYGAPGIYECQINKMIQGWGAALPEMHCGDTVEMIVPYQMAYGSQSSGIMPPYSVLRFNVRLEEVTHYQTAP